MAWTNAGNGVTVETLGFDLDTDAEEPLLLTSTATIRPELCTDQMVMFGPTLPRVASAGGDNFRRDAPLYQASTDQGPLPSDILDAYTDYTAMKDHLSFIVSDQLSDEALPKGDFRLGAAANGAPLAVHLSCVPTAKNTYNTLAQWNFLRVDYSIPSTPVLGFGGSEWVAVKYGNPFVTQLQDGTNDWLMLLDRARVVIATSSDNLESTAPDVFNLVADIVGYVTVAEDPTFSSTSVRGPYLFANSLYALALGTETFRLWLGVPAGVLSLADGEFWSYFAQDISDLSDEDGSDTEIDGNGGPPVTDFEAGIAVKTIAVGALSSTAPTSNDESTWESAVPSSTTGCLADEVPGEYLGPLVVYVWDGTRLRDFMEVFGGIPRFADPCAVAFREGLSLFFSALEPPGDAQPAGYDVEENGYDSETNGDGTYYGYGVWRATILQASDLTILNLLLNDATLWSDRNGNAVTTLPRAGAAAVLRYFGEGEGQAPDRVAKSDATNHYKDPDAVLKTRTYGASGWQVRLGLSTEAAVERQPDDLAALTLFVGEESDGSVTAATVLTWTPP